MNPIPQAVAWTLIHFCWQAAAIAAIYRVGAFAISRRTSQTRYLVALSSLLLMVVVAACTFAWELRSASNMSEPFAVAASEFQVPFVADLPRPTAPGITATEPAHVQITLADMLPWIDGLWLVGVFALTLRSLGGWWFLHRLRNSSISKVPAAVNASLQRICTALGLHRVVDLRLSGNIDSPMTMGAFRAIVLLPVSAMTSLGPEELEVVLAHELAHVRRADFFWNILQTIAETLFFFHPAVWWISSRIRHERELCCDDLALTVCPNPVTYANALFHLEEQRSRHLRLAMALDGHAPRHTLLMRISRILGEPMTRIPSNRLRPISLAAACAGLFVLLFPVPHVLASLNPARQITPAPSVSPAPAPAHAAVNSQVTAHIAKPVPHPVMLASATPEPSPASQAAPQPESKPVDSAQPHTDYIDRMKAAGYDVDLDKLIAMKIQNITPEYARDMANAGFGKPSADDLVACKIQGVTPEYIAQLKQQGFEIKSLHDAISFRIFNVTPEFVSGMKSAGFDNLTSKQILEMRVQGVTPEFARALKQTFPNVTAENLVQARIFRIDDEFIAQAKKHGFNNLPFNKLVQLRISGLLDDESVKQ
jgi:beta-lactamase regulating signal transducer with metallopeptidase domain